MKIIDAAGADGRSILPDLQGASPGGGFVASESRPSHQIAVGHLVRHHGWSVVAAIAQDGITGLCRLAVIDADGDVGTLAFARSQSGEVRTDAMNSPDTLFKLPRNPGGALAGEKPAARRTPARSPARARRTVPGAGGFSRGAARRLRGGRAAVRGTPLGEGRRRQGSSTIRRPGLRAGFTSTHASHQPCLQRGQTRHRCPPNTRGPRISGQHGKSPGEAPG
jgi:hypothetical protein